MELVNTMDMYLYEVAIKNDDVKSLKKIIQIHPVAGTFLLSCTLYKYVYSFKCIDYLMNHFMIDGKYIADFHISKLFHAGPHYKKRTKILRALVGRGYMINDTNLQSAVIMGVNKRVLEYMFNLPDTNWEYHECCRIPFLAHHMIREDWDFFHRLFKLFIRRRDTEKIREEMNTPSWICYLYPLETITTNYRHCQARVEKVNSSEMVQTISIAKTLIDHGADPFYFKSILKDHSQMNPKLHDFMESYAHQKQAYQILQDLLRIQKRYSIEIPINAMINIATSHMTHSNLYTQKFVDRLYKKYYLYDRKEEISTD